MIYEYKNPLLGGKPCMIHDGFTSSMDLFCKLLGLSGCKFIITCAFDLNHTHLTAAEGAIVTPATHGNHLVGHALDGDIVDNTGVQWNSEKLETFAPESPNFNTDVWADNKGIDSVFQLIKSVRQSDVLRWGGDFHATPPKKPDTVHFDDGLNIRNPARWQQIYDELTTAKT